MNEQLKKDIENVLREYIFEGFCQVASPAVLDINRVLRNHGISDSKVQVSSPERDLVVYIRIGDKKYQCSIQLCHADFSELKGE